MVFPCRCFSFSFEEEHIEHETRTPTLSTSTETFYTASSDLSRSLSNLVEKPNNLRVFTLVELKEATKNFCRAWKIGQDGFGSVYRGVIKSLEHPFHDIQVTVKYADGSLQACFFNSYLFRLYMHQNVYNMSRISYCMYVSNNNFFSKIK